MCIIVFRLYPPHNVVLGLRPSPGEPPSNFPGSCWNKLTPATAYEQLIPGAHLNIRGKK